MATYLYEEIKNYLLALIKENEGNPQYKLPSENALAKKFNVTRVTAKKAFNILAKEGYVYSFHGKGTFITGNKVSVPPATKEFVCMFLPNLDSRFVTDIISGAREMLMKSGIELLICACPSDSVMGSKLITNVVDTGVRGIIFFPENNRSFCNESLLLTLSGFPIVFVDRVLSEINANSVASDHKGAAFSATSLLIKKSCKEIGMITYRPEAASSVKLRIEGYIEAHMKNNIAISDENILFLDDNNPEDDYKKIMHYLSENPHIDGLVTMGGAIGLKLYRAICTLGIKVPEELKIIFFDQEYTDFEQLLPFSPTCINQNGKRIGLEAAKIILNLLKINNSIVINNKIFIDCVISERDSTKETETSANEFSGNF